MIPSREFPEIGLMRGVVVMALIKAGHTAAAEFLDAGDWTIIDSDLRIECVSIGNKMLSLTVNDAAKEIVHQELQRIGGPTDFVFVSKW